jgi:DNA mismatch repair protein MutH
MEIDKIKNINELLKRALTLRGKTLSEITNTIKKSDDVSRVVTKGDVGYVLEQGFFGIEKNSYAKPDIETLDVEIKTFPIKYNQSRTKFSVKEALSLNIINYEKEYKNKSLKESSLFEKSKKILFFVYLHDKNKDRSEYIIKFVFLWTMDSNVLNELEPDYQLILNKIKEGKAHEIHQTDHKFLTLCPKHSGKFIDSECKKSKRIQPFSKIPAEVRAFRLKTKYLSLILDRQYDESWKTPNQTYLV